MFDREIYQVKILVSLTALAVAIVSPASAEAATFVINGHANIFAAGLTTIPAVVGGPGSLPPSMALSGGETLSITANGLTSHWVYSPTIPAEGYAVPMHQIVNVTGSAIGNWTTDRAMNLLGVFTGSGAGVNSIFAIGAGGTFVAPAGATGLSFGFADTQRYGTPGTSSHFDNNGGAITATVVATQAVPEPATWALMLAGFGVVGYAMRSRRKSTMRYVSAV